MHAADATAGLPAPAAGSDGLLHAPSDNTAKAPTAANSVRGLLLSMQEVITLSVFVPFAVFYLKEPLKLDYLWAAICILGAVYFVFRSKLVGA